MRSKVGLHVEITKSFKVQLIFLDGSDWVDRIRCSFSVIYTSRRKGDMGNNRLTIFWFHNTDNNNESVTKPLRCTSIFHCASLVLKGCFQRFPARFSGTCRSLNFHFVFRKFHKVSCLHWSENFTLSTNKQLGGRIAVNMSVKDWVDTEPIYENSSFLLQSFGYAEQKADCVGTPQCHFDSWILKGFVTSGAISSTATSQTQMLII